MCVMCRSTPCKAACPNKPEEKAVINCSECNVPLYEGDNAYFITTPMNGVYILCEDCIRKTKKEVADERNLC